jgi:CDP-paratose 2-epimerase
MKVFITGGAGFIGTNAANYFCRKRADVVVFDNLSRAGSEENLAWLQTQGPVKPVRGDLRNFDEISRALRADSDINLILHLAAQVAVTTSVVDPRQDFEINALGTLNLLEAIRLSGRTPILIYASTNKVYGGMEDVSIIERNGHYTYGDYVEGIPEERPLDFHSPYGCSKGAADQYVRDYCRIYGLPTVVFRQSCIYGDHQFGVEDQGWVAWLTIAALLGYPLTIYGDGKQTRDVLHIDDLVRAYDHAFQQAARAKGQIYNIGGGPQLQLSLLELLEILRKRLKKPLQPAFADWRPGDQKVYVSSIKKAEADLNWRPSVSTHEGVDRLINWVNQNETAIRRVLAQTHSAQARTQLSPR